MLCSAKNDFATTPNIIDFNDVCIALANQDHYAGIKVLHQLELKELHNMKRESERILNILK